MYESLGCRGQVSCSSYIQFHCNLKTALFQPSYSTPQSPAVWHIVNVNIVRCPRNGLVREVSTYSWYWHHITLDQCEMCTMLSCWCLKNDTGRCFLAVVQSVIQRDRQLHQQKWRLTNYNTVCRSVIISFWESWLRVFYTYAGVMLNVGNWVVTIPRHVELMEALTCGVSITMTVSHHYTDVDWSTLVFWLLKFVNNQAPYGLWDCKNRACSISWLNVVNSIPNYDVVYFVS